MISKKAISALLTGASLATLSIASASRVNAGTTLIGVSEAVRTWTTNTDFLNFDSTYFGVFTNTATISDGSDNDEAIGDPGALSVFVDDDMTIDQFVNASGGTIQAIDDAASNNPSTTYAVANAMVVTGDVPLFTNNGLVDAYAFAHDVDEFEAFAEAYAAGVVWAGDVGSGPVAKLVNNGTVGAEADVFVRSFDDDAEGFAGAVGVHQDLFGLPGAEGKDVVNNHGVISAAASGDVRGEFGGFLDVMSVGVLQYMEGFDQAKASVKNTNIIVAEADALVEADLLVAAATYVAAFGIVQDVAEVGDVPKKVGDGDSYAKAVVNNSGSIGAFVNSKAVATYEAAFSLGVGGGIKQRGGDAVDTSLYAKNTGAIDVGVVSKARLYAGTYVSAYAFGVGIDQGGGEYFIADIEDAGVVGEVTAINTGDIYVSSVASAKATYVTYSDDDDERSGPGAISAFAAGVGIGQEVDNFKQVSAVASNSGNIDVVVDATARGDEGTYAFALAQGLGVAQQADADGLDPQSSTVLFTNTGNVSVWSGVESSFSQIGAVSWGVAGSFGVDQSAYDGKAKAKFENARGASVYVGAEAATDGFFSFGVSYGIGVDQEAITRDKKARVLTKNFGEIGVVANAKATATYMAVGGAVGVGVGQEASGEDSQSRFVNNGVLSVAIDARAKATGTPKVDDLTAPVRLAEVANSAFAGATYVAGVVQVADGTDDVLASHYGTSAQNVVTNRGSILVEGYGKATAATYAGAGVDGLGVIQSSYSALSVVNSVDNDGAIDVEVKAVAKGNGTADAFVSGTGIVQNARAFDFSSGKTGLIEAGELAKNVVNNTNWIGVDAVAIARNRNGGSAFIAEADALGMGVYQEAGAAMKGRNNLSNSSWIDVAATAKATALEAEADAEALGVVQEFDSSIIESSRARFRNSTDGVIWSRADAIATGADFAGADALAVGVTFGSGVSSVFDARESAVPLLLDGQNAGAIYATAVASAVADLAESEYASATAIGVEMVAVNGALEGTFKNTSNGSIYAGAYAVAGDGHAWAIGINDPSLENTAHIVNKGDITAYAEGAQAMATGIGVYGLTSSVALTEGDADPDAVATITNDGGSIWAGYSTDGGKTVYRGNAINTGAPPEFVENGGPAPNAVLIELQNDDPVEIFGNININAADKIVVSDGTTRLDGIINPDMVLEGQLSIVTDGKLILGNTNTLEGPSHGYVDVLNINGSGTFGMELTPDDSSGAYPMLAANTASVGGKFSAIFLPGMYEDNILYDNIIDSGDLTGKFSSIVDNSALLETTLVYDGADNVDIKVERQGFGDVKGLTKNQGSAGDAIEKVYDDLPAGGDFSELVQQLFALNGGDYQQALNQLAGAEYAQMSQSVLWSTGQLNSTVTDRMDCGVNWVAGNGASDERGAQACFEPGKIQMWGRVGGGWNDNDGDKNAPGYDETQTAIYVGGDYAINDKVFLGLAGGYFDSSMDFDSWGGRSGASIDYDGAQIALYGGWDDGATYFRNIVSYGGYSGTSHRDVGIASSPVDPKGKFDTSVVSYYGEAGHRFAIANNTVATPFLGLDLASANLSSFTEKDPNGTGAALKVRGTDASSVATTLGVRVNGTWGAFSPDLTLAWKHEFAGATQSVNASFAGAPSGADFKVVSSNVGSDALLLGLGGTYQVNDASDIVVRYNGAFLSGYSSHELMARWTSKF